MGGVNIAESCSAANLNNGERAIMAEIAAMVGAITGAKTTTGSSNAYVLATDMGISALARGMRVSAKVNFSNTGACTLAVDSTAATAIKLQDGASPPAAAIVNGGLHDFEYDGTYWQLLNPSLAGVYQPLDADLTTWAGLTPSANAQSFVTAADYAAMRVLLGLTIGTNVQAYDADLTTWAGLTPSANAQSFVTAADYAAMRLLLGLVIGTNVQAYDAQLFSNIPQQSKSADYTLVLTDGEKHVFHPDADTSARTWTIPANASVAFPIGTAVTFVNGHGAGVITIAITSDTMRLASAGTTGSRSLAADGVATALKITATEWKISGSGLT